MRFRTELEKIKMPFNIGHNDKILLLGSCFTENISTKLWRYKFEILFNPFGTVYNPYSIAKIIDRLVNNITVEENELVKRDDLWHHFDFHGEVSGLVKQETASKINTLIHAGNDFIQKASVIFLTFGTSIVHRRKDNGEIVANNHKFPADFFVKERMGIDTLVSLYTSLLSLLHTVNPDIKTIFTVSPVRHIREGLTANQRSKAVLHLAIEEIVKSNKNTYYFPAYELLTDDLRDYRFYADDLVHPSTLAIEYIWQYFGDVFFDEKTKELNNRIEKITRSLEHKPFFPQSEKHKQFLAALQEEIKDFQAQYPYINLGDINLT